MESSILLSTKKILGLEPSYSPFDEDIIIHINSTFSVLEQLGIGPDETFFIEDETATWDDYGVARKYLNIVRSYIFLKVRLLFDPPTTSFHIQATEEQIKQFEWRLNVMRENTLLEEV